ncbi:hypothetical protein, partial [Halomonas sp.]|uniref:hypothetical protein n=1 Tax=Halomonas sp. TaxID=1486246 RepID=UPI00356763BB
MLLGLLSALAIRFLSLQSLQAGREGFDPHLGLGAGLFGLLTLHLHASQALAVLVMLFDQGLAVRLGVVAAGLQLLRVVQVAGVGYARPRIFLTMLARR